MNVTLLVPLIHGCVGVGMKELFWEYNIKIILPRHLNSATLYLSEKTTKIYSCREFTLNF